MAEWAKDCKIDPTELMHTMYALPMLHSKYLTHHQNYKVTLRKFTLKYQSLRLVRQKYFNGEFTKEQLEQHGWDQYQFKRPMKAEMESLLDASPDLQELAERSLYIEGLVQACDSILRDINSRYFLMRSIVDLTKFQAGA